MSPASSLSDSRAAARLCAAALFGIWLLGFAAVVFFAIARASPLGVWILGDVLAPQRILPVIALGIAFGLTCGRAFVAACVLLGLGMVAGFAGQYWLLWLLDKIPPAAAHLFLTGPICYLTAGLALVAGARLRSIVLPVCAAIFGAMLAVLIQLTDPSLHEPPFTLVPILIALWIVPTFACLIRAFWRGWFPLFARILGSWMLAIGLLYGGVSIVPVRKPPTAPPPMFDKTIPGLPTDRQP